MLFRSLLIGILFLSYTQTALSQALTGAWHSQHWDIMGTRIHVELWHKDTASANQAIQKVKQEMQRIDQTMSPFIESSELSKVNRHAATQRITISSELFGLIQAAQQISRQSNGIFDITYASVGYLYNYRKQQRPSDKTIKKHLKHINYKNIQLFPKTSEIFFLQSGVRIDLGGIAKGHAVDNSIDILKKLGIQHALVSAGGDSRLLGDKKGKPWVTGIRHPRDKNKYIAILPLENTAISTSGDYERFFIKDNVRYHHIIQPKTGRSARNNQSVTILGPTATRTDALSTTLFIMETAAALKLINTLPEYEAIIIDKSAMLHFSSGLQSPVNTENKP